MEWDSVVGLSPDSKRQGKKIQEKTTNPIGGEMGWDFSDGMNTQSELIAIAEHLELALFVLFGNLLWVLVPVTKR